MVLLMLAFTATFIMRSSRANVKYYRLFLRVAFASHLLRLVNSVGWPPLRPFSWQGIQQWVILTASTSDAHYALVAFMFAPQPPQVAIMIGPLLFAVLRLSSFVKKNLSQRVPALGRPCDLVLGKKVSPSLRH
jgi:hypothetical protein